MTTFLPPSTRTTRDSLLRSLLILTVALLLPGAGLAIADGDAAVGIPLRPQTSVEGAVTAVSGGAVTLFNNAFVIDTTGARIVLAGDEGANDAVPAITVGARILAEGLTPLSTAGPGFPPLKATLVIVTPALNGEASGTIDSVNVAGGFFSLLSHNFLVDSNTRFTGEIKTLADLASGQLAFVTFIAGGPTPLALTVSARNVLLDQFISFRGTVVSIPFPPPLGMWQIDKNNVWVTAATRIVGEPRVGDVVDVLEKLHNPPPGSLMPTTLETLSIVKVGNLPPPPPAHEIDFTARVESIPSPPPLGHWKIGGNDVLVNGLTRITGSPVVGDTVEVKGFIQPPAGPMPSTATGQIVATSIEEKPGG